MESGSRGVAVRMAGRAPVSSAVGPRPPTVRVRVAQQAPAASACRLRYKADGPAAGQAVYIGQSTSGSGHHHRLLIRKTDCKPSARGGTAPSRAASKAGTREHWSQTAPRSRRRSRPPRNSQPTPQRSRRREAEFGPRARSLMSGGELRAPGACRLRAGSSVVAMVKPRVEPAGVADKLTASRQSNRDEEAWGAWTQWSPNRTVENLFASPNLTGQVLPPRQVDHHQEATPGAGIQRRPPAFSAGPAGRSRPGGRSASQEELARWAASSSSRRRSYSRPGGEVK